ncbi:MAG: hypothetical protein ACO26G_03235 [Rickettsiales bacterium]
MSESKQLTILGLKIFEYTEHRDDKSPTTAPPKSDQPNFFHNLFTYPKDQLKSPDSNKKLPVLEPTTSPKIYKATDLNDYNALIIIYHDSNSAGNRNDYLNACLKYNQEPSFKKYVDEKLKGLKNAIDKNKNNAGEDADGVAKRLSIIKDASVNRLLTYIGNGNTKSQQAKPHRNIICKPGENSPQGSFPSPNNSSETESQTSKSSKSVTSSKTYSFPHDKENDVVGSKDGNTANPVENFLQEPTSPFMPKPNNSIQTNRFSSSSTNYNTVDFLYDDDRNVIGSKDGDPQGGFSAFGPRANKHLERLANEKHTEHGKIESETQQSKQPSPDFFKSYGLKLDLLTSLGFGHAKKSSPRPPSPSPSPLSPDSNRSLGRFTPSSTLTWGNNLYVPSRFDRMDGITVTEWKRKELSFGQVLGEIGNKFGFTYNELDEPNPGGGRGKG